MVDYALSQLLEGLSSGGGHRKLVGAKVKLSASYTSSRARIDLLEMITCG